MTICNTQANDMATTENNWQTPGTSNPGHYIVAVGLESPSSAMQKAALALWNDEAIHLLLRLAGRDTPPSPLSRLRLSAAD